MDRVAEDAPVFGHQMIICLVGVPKALATQPAEVSLALGAGHVVAARGLLNGRPTLGAGLGVGELPLLKLLVTLGTGLVPE